MKEIGEADKPESTNNLCGYTLNRRMWERQVCQGVRQEVSTAISAKVILGENLALRLVQTWVWYIIGETTRFGFECKGLERTKSDGTDITSELLLRSRSSRPRGLQLTHRARLERSIPREDKTLAPRSERTSTPSGELKVPEQTRRQGKGRAELSICTEKMLKARGETEVTKDSQEENTIIKI